MTREVNRLIENDEYDNAYWHFYSHLSLAEREALKALFRGDQQHPEEALRRVSFGPLPAELTRRALDAYDRMADLVIKLGQDKASVVVRGQQLGKQAFRREMVKQAIRICAK